MCSSDLLLVGQAGESYNSTSTLDGLDDLRGEIAGKSESSSTRVDLHDTSHSLLCLRGHAVCFVENDDFVFPARQCYLLLSEHLDLLSNSVDSTVISMRRGCGGQRRGLPFVRGVEFKDSLFVGLFQERSGHTMDARGLTRTWRSLLPSSTTRTDTRGT